MTRSIPGKAEARGAVLELRGLSVEFSDGERSLRVVHDVSLGLRAGECLAVVGESGSGKSQTFLACLGLLAANGSASGSAHFEGRELIGAGESALNEVRGTRLVTVFQDPMNALTPQLTVGAQLAEVLTAHGLADATDARSSALRALARVGIPEPARRIEQYPHELSGGMRQRVVIAMALMAGPSVLIADEPTTALDVSHQAQVLELLGALRDQGLGIVLITHDLGVVAAIADRVAVMYAGRIVELGDAADVLARPGHPYTSALLESIPRLDAAPGHPLRSIAGQPPRPGMLPPGCAFEPRCGARLARCGRERPELAPTPGERLLACHLASCGSEQR